jgi:hypothetical protein
VPSARLSPCGGAIDIRVPAPSLARQPHFDRVEYRRDVYVAAAVSEIAALRAELFGAQVG